jgi:hypothetical protein
VNKDSFCGYRIHVISVKETQIFVGIRWPTKIKVVADKPEVENAGREPDQTGNAQH